MSRPGDQDQQTAAVPAAVPGTDPTAGSQAWDAAVPAPTETYPASAPTYPDADPYGRQPTAFPAGPEQYGRAAYQQYGQAAYQQYGQAPHPSAQYPQPGMVYPQPGTPYVAPGAPHPVGYGYPAREAPMCGLAVASLVCGIAWVYWITSILAIIFAAVALGRIKREGLRGRGLAVAGLVLGLVWIALLLIGVLGVAVSGTSGVLPFING